MTTSILVIILLSLLFQSYNSDGVLSVVQAYGNSFRVLTSEGQNTGTNVFDTFDYLLAAEWNSATDALYGLWYVTGTETPELFRLNAGEDEWDRVISFDSMIDDGYQLVQDVAISPDGRTVAVLVFSPDAYKPLEYESAIMLFDVETGSPVTELVMLAYLDGTNDRHFEARSLDWSPADSVLAVEILQGQAPEAIALLDVECLLSSQEVCSMNAILPDAGQSPTRLPTWIDNDGMFLIYTCLGEQGTSLCQWDKQEKTTSHFGGISSNHSTIYQLDVLGEHLLVRSDQTKVYDLGTLDVAFSAEVGEGGGEVFLVPAYALAGILEAHGAGDD
jgi:hypothetical protein